MRPIKNKKHRDPRYFLHEVSRCVEQDDCDGPGPWRDASHLYRALTSEIPKEEDVSAILGRYNEPDKMIDLSNEFDEFLKDKNESRGLLTWLSDLGFKSAARYVTALTKQK